MSALKGDNIVERRARARPGTAAPRCMGWLETVEIDETRLQKLPFRMPVQWVNRPNLDFRGFAGTIASGIVRPGDRVRVAALRAGEPRRPHRRPPGGDLAQAVAGQSVTLTLADEIDVTRGDVISAADAPAEVADQFEATVVWMGEEPMLRGRTYLMKIGTKTVTATIAPLKYRINVEHARASRPPRRSSSNEIGVCELELDQPIAFDPYAENRETGGFILIDRLTNHTVGAGMLQLRAAPRAQHPRAARRRRQGGARRAQGPAALRALVHRALGRGQVHDRQPRGEEAPRAWAATPTSSTATTCATD